MVDLGLDVASVGAEWAVGAIRSSARKEVPVSRFLDRVREVAPWLAQRGGRRATVRTGPGRGLRIGREQASADYRLGANELPVQEAVVASVSEGDVFYDIGSNVGFFALVAARLVGTSGQAYAFEPLPANLQQIAANSSANRIDNLTIIPYAVGDRAGAATLYLDAHPGGATLSVDDSSRVGGQMEVEVACIDDLVASGRCRPPDVVKIDVEGLEPAVLRGMERTLSEHQPVVICELDAETREGVEAKVLEVTALLEGHRYSVERLPDSYAEEAFEVVHLLAKPPMGAGVREGEAP